jgi:hypothetical protein
MSAVDVQSDPFVKKQNSDTWSAWFRRRRFALIEQQVERISSGKGSCRIIDVGGRAEYWAPALNTLQRCKAHVTIVNIERTQPKNEPMFEFHYGDACDLGQFADGAFDLAHSNSLIEHLGNWSNMRRCADEIGRVADCYYVQTPNFWFPYEPHFRVPLFHWLPEQLRARLVMQFSLGYFNRASALDKAMINVESVRLIDNTQFASLFPDAEIRYERFLGFSKSLIAVREKKLPLE